MSTDDRLNKLKGNPVLFAEPVQDPDAPGPRVLDVDNLEHVKLLCETFGVYFKLQSVPDQEHAAEHIGVNLRTLSDWAAQTKLPAPKRCPQLADVIYDWQTEEREGLKKRQEFPHNLRITLVGDTARKKRSGVVKPRAEKPLPPPDEDTYEKSLQRLSQILRKTSGINSITEKQTIEHAVNFVLRCWVASESTVVPL